jgi:hypothetical protein
MADRFVFEKSTVRYRNKRTGRFVSESRLRALSQEAIAESLGQGRVLSGDLFAGRITLDEWERSMAQEIKSLSLQTYKLGRGEMTARDYGIVGNQLRRQYQYLRNFSLEIAQGRHSEAMIRSRADNYFQKSVAFYEKGKREAFSSSGAKWERRLLGSQEPCAQCPGYAALGWQPINTLPNVTEACDCRAKCKCRFEYSFSQFRPTNSINFSFGWIA